MKITIQTLTGSKYFLKVKSYHKVKEVKVKIYDEIDIRNKVRLMWQNKLLEDCVTLRALGVTDESTVQMLIEPEKKITLNIQTMKKGMISVKLSDSCSILDLMEMLSTSTLESTPHTSDFYFGRTHLSDQNLPLHFYGITENSVIVKSYEGSFQLELDDARNFTFVRYITVMGSNTIKEVREQILETLNEPLDNQRNILTENDIVIFHRPLNRLTGDIGNLYHELDRDELTVSQCGIKPLDILIFIRYHGREGFSPDIVLFQSQGIGRSRRLYGIYNLESVQSLHLKVQHQFHVPYEKQTLLIDGKNTNPRSQTVGKDKFDKIIVKIMD